MANVTLLKNQRGIVVHVFEHHADAVSTVKATYSAPGYTVKVTGFLIEVYVGSSPITTYIAEQWDVLTRSTHL
jgi:hypothetical protein